MKKTAAIILLIIAIVVLGIGITVNMLGKEKNSITPDQFKTALENKGFIVQSVKQRQFSDLDYINEALVAIDSVQANYQLEFYELSDVSYANMFFENNREIFEKQKSNTSLTNMISASNYAKYELSSNGLYMVVSRINNTVLYCRVNAEYEMDAKDAIKNLGY